MITPLSPQERRDWTVAFAPAESSDGAVYARLLTRKGGDWSDTAGVYRGSLYRHSADAVVAGLELRSLRLSFASGAL